MTPQEALKLKAQARLRLKAKTAAPEGTGFDQFKTMLQSGMVATPLSAPASIAAHPAEAAQAIDDTVRTAANEATFGLADRVAGYMNDTGTEAERARSEEATKRLGNFAPVAGISGSMLIPGKLLSNGITASRLPGLIGKLGPAIDTAIFGGAQAAGNDENIAEGAATGAGMGLLGQGGSKLVQALLKKMPATMSKDELYAAGSAAFKRAKAAGVIFTPEGIGKLRDTIHNDFAELSYHPKLQPGAEVALGELERLSQGGNVDFQGLKTAREIASDAFIPGNKKNNMLVGKAIKRIDDFAANAPPEHILTGDAAAASQAIKDARAFWHKASKLDMVDTLVSKAETRAGSTGSGGNIENATRQNLRKILDSEAKSRGFTPDEKDALLKAVMGSATQNNLRRLGKLSPVGNGLIATLEGLGAVGGHAAGSGLAAPVIIGGAIAGTGAKFTSEAMQRNAVERLQKLIASGGRAAAIKPKLDPAKAAQIDRLFRALMIGGTGAVAAGGAI